ncbi:unnamed protein product, partial [Allacma fusca]
ITPAHYTERKFKMLYAVSSTGFTRTL